MSDRSFLEEISIRSIGVIDSASLEISPGLTVLTGETGAGKTMILSALNLILGGKSDSALVRVGSERLVASGRFRVANHQTSNFEDSGAIIEDGQVIITRSVTSDGKSKASANGIAVPVSVLTSLSEHLVEVHAQAANINIGKSSRQRELLDRFGGQEIEVALARYKSSLETYQELKSRIAAFKKSIDAKDSALASLREFVAAMKKLNLVAGEYAEIEIEIARLSSVEELRIASQQAHEALVEEESGALTSLGIARRAIENARSKDPSLEAIFGVLSESFYLLEDANTTLSSYVESLEADPVRLDFLHARKSEINNLIKKFGGSQSHEDEVNELLRQHAVSTESIADLEGGDEKLAVLEKELVKVKKDLLMSARALTDSRVNAAKSLGAKVTTEIQQLSMPHTSMNIHINSPDYAAVKESDFTATGCDEIVMQLSAHKGAPLVSLTKGASGGEMSRVMLALEVVIAATHPVGTYVFDEVDAGVGGKAAIEVGRRLHALSRHAQVIVVTHLPQVAAWADSHFVVNKNSDGSVSQSDVRAVDGDERLTEIARMLAGLEGSQSAKEHAAELLSLKR
ncbi:MAG: DNA repair protein RecN [Actinobacteria bacterium]|uniref:DNA repair protein RecN n=1 Tax=freshwater metagenome TaxID=449393 RepID=A0A6J6MKK5_9ZZZZ|nr:DNA repair protein RecN [Actinomycetota bacterium]